MALYNKFAYWACLNVFLTSYFHTIVTSSQATIHTLPGFNGTLPFVLETGYVTVGEANDVELFYYFIESEKDPENDPLLLWLSGGPGCSSLNGLLDENGPLSFDYVATSGDLPTLVLNPYSWTKIGSIIYLDSPVGTGFSYASSSEGYYSSSTKSAADIYDFLRKWLLDHPMFIKSHLYICGDSFGGMYVPMVALEIVKGNEAGYLPYMALQSAKDSCHDEYLNVDPNNLVCLKYVQAIAKCTARINREHILEDCIPYIEANLNKWGQRSLQEVSMDISLTPEIGAHSCWARQFEVFYNWANDRDVQQAIHIRDRTSDARI